jgi:2'-5' RNA ligase superfamily
MCLRSGPQQLTTGRFGGRLKSPATPCSTKLFRDEACFIFGRKPMQSTVGATIRACLSYAGPLRALLFFTAGLAPGVTPGFVQTAAAQQNPVTAIDILLEPDSTMLQRAEADNARLLAIFPKGYSLDASHRPHITIVQRFVRTDNLDKVFAAAEKVFAAANVASMKLEAYRYHYTPGGDIGVANIEVRPSAELLKLQQEMIAAVSQYTLETGPIGAFTAPQANAAEDALLIDYVATFVPKQIGDHYHPHVSLGVATRDYLDKMVTEPFAAFTFSPAGAAVYHLGPYGTAAKKLKEWK